MSRELSAPIRKAEIVSLSLCCHIRNHYEKLGSMPAFQYVKKAPVNLTAPALQGTNFLTRALSSSGKPINTPLREEAERRFHWSFADVRIHSDSEATKAANLLGARAFAYGRHIVTGEGIDPGRMSPTLGHELAHIAQIRGLSSTGVPQLSDPASMHERAAERAGSLIAAGQDVGPLLAPAPPGVVYRQGQTTIPAVKNKILTKHHDDISELAKLIPNSGTGKVKYKEVTINGAKHIFLLDFTLIQQSTTLTMLTGVNAATFESVTSQGATPQTITHTIHVTFSSGIVGDPVETFYHELVHARILIDKSLPLDQQSDTYRRYAQLTEMATDPGLLAVTGAKVQKAAVVSAIQALRGGVSAVPGFNASLVNPNLSTDDAIYEFVINEKFTNTESTSVVKGAALANNKIAERYAKAVRSTFEKGLAGQARQTYTNNTTILGLVDQREEALKKALLDLYNVLDAQLKTIANIKASGFPGASANPKPPSVMDFDPLLSPPVDVNGNSVRTP